MKILFTGGGTAGHIFPIISIIREIRKNYPKKRTKFFYVGPNDEFIRDLMEKEGIRAKIILAGKLRRYFSFDNFIDIFIKFPLGFLQALYYVFTISPDLIFSKGGYGSLPVVLAGWLLMTPIICHESDASPGLANRISGFFSLKIITAFPEQEVEYFSKKKMISLGNPIRPELLQGSSQEGESFFNLTKEKPVLLVLGGSQGAQRINDKILLDANNFLSNFELIHQTGKSNFEQIKREILAVAKKELLKYYHPFPFLNEKEMALAYKSADFVISRAGANSIFEIAASGKPAILIPLHGSAQDHQLKNGYVYAKAGAGIVLEESNFTPNFAIQKIKMVLSDQEQHQKMLQNARKFATIEAGKNIAEYIMKFLA